MAFVFFPLLPDLFHKSIHERVQVLEAYRKIKITISTSLPTKRDMNVYAPHA